MEDEENLVFTYNPNQLLFCKKFFSQDEIEEIGTSISGKRMQVLGTLASGSRTVVEDDLENHPFIKERLQTVLADYFPDMEIGNRIRFYKQIFGGIRKHTDASLDNHSNYTLLVYMNDSCEGGELVLETNRNEIEQPDKKHFQYKVTPKSGYGVVFKKNILHWAEEVFSGCKEIMLMDFYSVF